MSQHAAALQGEKILEPQEKDLGAFSVRRLLPASRRKIVGPWIFFDHMGPARFSAGGGIVVPGDEEEFIPLP